MKNIRLFSLVVLVLSLSLFLAACGGDKALAKLNGSWVLSVDATIDGNPEMKKSIPSGEAGELARVMMEKMLGSMTLTFDAKAKNFSGEIMGKAIDNSPFEVVSEKGDVVVLKMQGDTASFTIKGDMLEMRPEPNTVLVFKRK